jgi:hypothetical protein
MLLNSPDQPLLPPIKHVHRERRGSEVVYFPGMGGKFFSSFCAPLLSLSWFFSGFLPGFNRMLGSTYPNELLCSKVIHTKDESPDVNG